MTKARRTLNTYALVFAIIVFVAVLTWVVPGGVYERQVVDGREVVKADSFQRVPAKPQGPFAVLIAPVRGFADPSVALIVGFVLIVGGVFSVMTKTGAVEALIRSAAGAYRRHPLVEKLFIPVFMVLFSIAGATFGMSEEVIPFVLLFIPLALSLGYDSVTGVMIPFIGAGAGFAGAFMNPFTVGIAQGIAELPLFSGFVYRIVCWVVVTAVCTWFVARYARKIKADPKRSITYEADREKRAGLKLDPAEAGEKTNLRHKLVGLTLLLGLGVMIFGVLEYGWYIDKITAVFLGIGLAAGVVGGLRIDEFTDAFIQGAKDLVGTVLIIVLARGILYIAQDGRIIDSILQAMASAVQGAHPAISANGMFIVQSLINFFIPSGSAKAALTMPVMVPLADLTGISRQVAVLAYQFGDGFSNMIVPTSAITMTVLTSGGIPFEKWLKVVWRLQVVLFLTGFALLGAAVLFHWK
ncbi:MAG: Na+/H+ antiporter NhaC family protein [Acidobacteriota bacterium]|nr:Na+/H+ antiporter NhaC family protein [Acidobacteriota bacterium]